ncbi:LOW QUALITY PROTEIN: myogenesis-regulating glycosidase-like [Amphiura filiformis]|uniref:LOW QUALITY PROTEIN: myogenesis-regulating glycosidase-like n=1 Tax=Amphiura filiformis TaxID=82378 RepID=UPI003B217ACC
MANSSSRNYQYIPLKTMIAMSKSPDDAGNVVNTTLLPSILVTDDSDGTDGTGHHQGATTDPDGMVNLDLQEVDLNEIRRRTQSSIDPDKIDIGYPIKILKTPREIKIKLVVVTLFLIIIAVTTCVLIFYVEEPLHFDIGHATLYVDSKLFELRHDNRVTRGQIGLRIPNVLPSTCAPSNKNTLCVEWNGYAQLRVDWDEDPIKSTHLDCYKVSWVSYLNDLSHRDCYSLTNAHWYGGAEVMDQNWPLEKGDLLRSAYLTGNEVYEFGPVAERYWISSHGVAIRVDKDSPLYVSVNMVNSELGKALCFEADYSYDNKSPYPNANNSNAQLEYTMCFSKEVKTVHRNMTVNYLSKPQCFPANPSLPTPHGQPLHAERTTISIKLAYLRWQKVESKWLSKGTLEIRCGYSSKDGDLDFAKSRFIDSAGMIAQIKDYGFQVAVSVNPFANVDSKRFQVGVMNNYWVKEARGEAPGLSRWNRGIASLLDTSSSNAVDWFSSKLDSFQQYSGLDYFTFDYGEAKYLPIDYKTKQLLRNPCDYTTNYANMAYKKGNPENGSNEKGNPTVVRSVFLNQNISAIVQTIPKSLNNSDDLKTIIPTVLTLGIVGYPYVMLDMAFPLNATVPPKELFVRWLQISAFLPAMKIPVPIWEYDEDTVRIIKNWINFHQDTIAPKVASLGSSVMTYRDPIIRPMWWMLPDDENAQNCDSQFLIGDDIIVAPILDLIESGKSKASRQVYLPAGVWVNQLTDQQQKVEKPDWYDVEASLEEVPYFTRITKGYQTPSPER